MDEYISKRELFDKTINRNHAWLYTTNSKGENLKEIVEQMTPAENKGEWIPVYERLPKDGQNVLFCDIDGDIMIGYHIKDRPVTHFSQDGTYEDMKNVRAWQPLPEPYKGESKGKE